MKGDDIIKSNDTLYKRLNDYINKQSAKAGGVLTMAVGTGGGAGVAAENESYALCGILTALSLFFIGAAVTYFQQAAQASFRRDVEISKKPGGLENSIEED
ncbi:MAG: hypothetical protein KJ955_00235 [Nanoarchaeota archaeon]|nr:hypothetical protein [Nanoarchaeota archaeon]